MRSNVTRPKVGIIIQARLGSTRLPGKVLKKIMPGKTILGYLLKRLSSVRYADIVVTATTLNKNDDALAAWLKNNKHAYFRGSESNCLKRFQKTAEKFGLDVIVRITSDCPLILPEIIDDMIHHYLRNIKEVDYLSNRKYTNFPEGTDVEIFNKKMLNQALKNSKDKAEKEHINYFFLNRPKKYKIRYFNHELSKDLSGFKLSIDTKNDLTRIRNFFKKYKLPIDFNFSDLTKLLTEKMK